MGLVLVMVPWSAFWDRNYFAETIPVVRHIINNGFVRGAVSGLGLVNVLTGLVDLNSLLRGRRFERVSGASAGSPSNPPDVDGSRAGRVEVG